MSASSTSDLPKNIAMVVWPIVIVAALLVAIVARRLVGSDPKLPVPTARIAAGHLLGKSDLIDRRVDGYGLGDVVRDRAALIGHVASKTLESGTPIEKAAVTRAVPKTYPSLVRLRFRSEHATTADVRPGDRVQLLFAPTGDSPDLAPAAIDAVLIASAEDGDAIVFFVAIAPDDRLPLLARVGRARLSVAAP
jgi:hypothetical protein